MNIKEFREDAIRTFIYRDKYRDSAHMLQGIGSELLAELDDALNVPSEMDIVNVGEELADAQWYMAVDSIIWDYNIKDDHNFELEVYEIFNVPNMIGQLNNLEKRFAAYELPMNLEGETRKGVHEAGRIELVNSLFRYTEHLGYHLGIDMADARIKNIAKLKERYPEKFTTENALNRNLTAERQALEGK